jgi:hypothetical protein
MPETKKLLTMKSTRRLGDYLPTAFGPAATENFLAVAGRHAFAKSVLSFSDDIGWRL